MLNWEAAFRVVAHEIRTPAGVIAGYARLLEGGRLDETTSLDALRQVERAAGRLGDIAQQASDLAHWLEPRADLPQQLVPIHTILDSAVHAVSAPDRVRVVRDPATAAWQIRTSEPRALSIALAAVIDATARQEAHGAELSVTARRTATAGWCDIVVGPSEWITRTLDQHERGAGTFNLEGGGIGLRLLVGVVVFDAHGARLWASAEQPGVTGVRVPVGAEG